MTDISSRLAEELSIAKEQAQSAVSLIEQGNTVPFIARYRKEATGNLSDELLRRLADRLEYLTRLDGRKSEVMRLIDAQGKLTEELKKSISEARGITEVDDLYRPYRPKRRTRAAMAKEKGLEPLAALIFEQQTADEQIDKIAQGYVNKEKNVATAEEAVQGALDIIAERIADDAAARSLLRSWLKQGSSIISKADEEKSGVYEMYSDFSEPVKKIVPHRVLALNRGEKEKILSIKLSAEHNEAQALIDKALSLAGQRSRYLRQSADDAYKRLIFPSLEREIRNELTEKAEEQAIRVFGVNLKNLLLSPPVRGKTVLGLDPGYRTGNKAAVVDETGRVLDTAVIYMTLPHHDMEKAKKQLASLIEKHNVDIIAIGNGTASKESEAAVALLLKEIKRKVYYAIVSEAGASVYSASALGTDEFPDFDVALRSAVSIARRLQDPLAELVKIDPKAIGVGQYQHDVNQKRLAQTLAGAVEDCVNTVGVDLNTASASLLKYVAGITPSAASGIVFYRETHGRFTSRRQLKKVKGLGGKAFEQCAGFLRISDAENVLDSTAIHPESYGAVDKLSQTAGIKLKTKEDLPRLLQRLSGMDFNALAKEAGIGEPTLRDIIDELKKPGRDPRDAFEQPELRSDIMRLEDIKEGMALSGTVRNVTDFGAFVDIGVHQDGLVHISQMSDKFIKHPSDAVKTGDVVKVKVIGIDIAKKRISLTMKI
ncbi:MAG: Tex family protein [Christensenellales bacterium]